MSESVSETDRLARRAELRRRRNVDEVVTAELLASGWTFVSVLDGLLWCVRCRQPTVWKDASGKPLHHRCASEFDEESAK